MADNERPKVNSHPHDGVNQLGQDLQDSVDHMPEALRQVPNAFLEPIKDGVRHTWENREQVAQKVIDGVQKFETRTRQMKDDAEQLAKEAAEKFRQGFNRVLRRNQRIIIPPDGE